MLTDPLAILSVLGLVIWFSLWICKKYSWAERLSSIMWMIFLGALASNIGLIPKEAEIYHYLTDWSVPLAVCLILFKVDLKDVVAAGKPMLAAFALACAATVVGVMVAGISLDFWLSNLLSDDAWKLAGPYTGTYIGGSLNFFALWSALEIGQTDLFAAANAVDNLTLIPLYTIWVVVPIWFAGKYPVAKIWKAPVDDEASDVEKRPVSFRPIDVVMLILASLVVMWLSEVIKINLLDAILPGIPTILVVTTLALVLGQVPFVKNLEGAWELGYIAFFVFFAAVGALIDLYQALVLSPILFAYVMIIIIVHMVILYGFGRLLKMDLAVLTIASAASKAGPPIALALAESKHWGHLALPGVLMGLLGYAIGNYIGFAAAYLMHFLLGG